MEKQRRIKVLSLCAAIIAVIGLTVAFATLSTTLSVNGTSYLDAAKWGIKFENLSEPVSIGTATTTGTAKIEESKSAEITGINVSLSTPGDKVTYTVDLVNEGDINAKIDKIEKTALTEEQQKYLTFKVTDKDYNEVQEGDILSSGETKKLIITVEFIKDLTKEDLPTNVSTITLSYKLNFVQTEDDIIPTKSKPIMMKSNKSKAFWQSTYNNKISTVDVLTNKTVPSNVVESWDVSENQDGSVLAWIINDTENSGMYRLYIGGDGGVYAPNDSRYLFGTYYQIGHTVYSGSFRNTKTMNLINLDTSKVTNMSYMFLNCLSLTNLDLSSWNTSNVTDMSYMFACSKIESAKSINLDTGNVHNVLGMFTSCEEIYNGSSK